jgi:hypothetical protein
VHSTFVVSGTGSSASHRGITLSRLSSVLLSISLGLVACGGGGGGGDGGDGDDDGVGPDAGPGGGGDAGPDAGPGFEQAPLIEGLTTLAGAGIAGSSSGDREHALFNNPVNLVMADDGNMLVADFDNSMIRRVTPEGDVSTISDTPEEGLFVRPFGLALSGGTLYVQTDGNSLGQPGMPGGALWSMPASGGAPVLVSDNIGRGRGMEQLPDGKLVLADFQSHIIQVFSPTDGTMTLLAGGRNAPGYRDGQATQASFDRPYDVVALADGSLIVSDFGNNRLRRVDLAGNVTTFAGTGAAGRDDGPIASATFNAPQGLAVDADGNIYVTDTGNFLIRRISPDGQVTTIAGNASPGYKDSEDPLAGQMFAIEGIDVGTDGYLYIADGTRGEPAPYHRIRRLTLE